MAAPDRPDWLAGVTTDSASTVQVNEVMEPLEPATPLAPPAAPVAYEMPVAPEV